MAKKTAKRDSVGGHQNKHTAKAYRNNGDVVFRTQAEKDEIERGEVTQLVSGIVDVVDFKSFKRHENNIKDFKRKHG
jgi:hypothetical protein